MTRNGFTSVVMALSVVVLAGCASTRTWQSVPQQPAFPQPASVATPVQVTQSTTVTKSVTKKVTGDFPTSSAKAVGKVWDVMHVSGFTGGYDSACKLLGLNAAQCKAYGEMHSAGKCVTMQVPNGIVLDALTFTRDGKHQMQRSVKVELNDPPTRDAEVCALGDGVVAMRFHGCDNHGLVRGWSKPLERVETVTEHVTVLVPQFPQPVAAPSSAACTEPLYLRLNVWEAKAAEFQGVRGAIEEARRDANRFAPNRVSRAFGKQFRMAHARGELQRDGVSRDVRVTLVKPVGKDEELFDGKIVGELKIALPNLGKSDVIKVVFKDLGRLMSPISDIQVAEKELSREVCGDVTNVHAIAR